MVEKKVPENLRADEPTFEHIRMPNLSAERSRLAREGASLSKEALSERAGALGISTEGTKDEIIGRVQDAVRGTSPET